MVSRMVIIEHGNDWQEFRIVATSFDAIVRKAELMARTVYGAQGTFFVCED